MQNITRRDFVKGMAAAGAGVGLVTILPNGVITSADAAWGWPSVDNKPTGNIVTNWWGSILEAWLPKCKKDGIYIEGTTENMNNKTYTLEFVQPVKLVAVIDKEIQTEGTWRSSCKHLVSVTPDGTVVMRDGVGDHDVDITWTLGDKTFKVTFHTTKLAGAHSIEVDSPITRGAFMVRLQNYFNWYHYHAVMDDGSDIDDDGEFSKSPRVRNYFDVTGDSDYVKPIESALEVGVLHAESSDECFYPMSQMTREDAAVIVCSAFHMESLEEDYISAFSDAKEISPECYDALNTLVGRNFLRGRTNELLAPTAGITDTEARILIENIDGRVSSPVWGTPVSNRKLNRIRPHLFTRNDQATVHYRFRTFKPSHEDLLGKKYQDATMPTTMDGYSEWSKWIDYIPGYTIDAFFGMQSSYDFPYYNLSHCVEFEAYTSCPGKEDSGVTRFIWRLDRPAWHDFAFAKLHDAGPNYPAVYQYFDNFQAAAFYIEGSKGGILFDGLKPTNTNITLIDRVNEVATKPYVFVLGHNHGDHNGVMPVAYEQGMDIYLCDRVGPKDTSWKIDVYNEKYCSSNKVIDSSRSGTYSGDNVHMIDEGFVFDLGNCKFEVVHLPGHEDGSLLLYSRETGLLFASDIYGVNRYWVADQFGANRDVKQDVLMSMHQQLMDFYTKDGAVVKEMYTGHNRTGVGGDYLTVWEQALQKLCNYGPDAAMYDRRGDGDIIVMDGHTYENTNWCGFRLNGKRIVAEYTGQYDGKVFRRMETDNRGTENALVESNLYFDYKTNAHLSNIHFKDAELVGHDFLYKIGVSGYDQKLPDGRYKFALENKFVPWEYDYEVKVAKNQTKVTFTPVAISDRIKGMTVNGKPHSSRCPVKVDTNGKTKIVVTGPDGQTTCTYTLTFVK